MKHLLALLLFVPSLCLAQIPDYVPLDGLVGWYPFNGNTENLAGEDGTLATTSTDWTMDRDGIDSSAIAFTALNSHAFGSLPADFQNNHYSYALWWRIDGAYNYNGYNLLTYPSSSPGNLGDNALAYTIGENWYYLNCPDATSGYTSSARIGYDHTLRALDCAVLEDMEQWNHSVVTVDGTMMKLYFNGTFIDSVSVDLDMSDFLGETLVLGARNNPAQNSLTTRILDEVGIWSRALSEAEIQALFTAEPPPSIPDYVPTDGLVAWYPFNGNAEDESDYGNSVEVFGATLTEDRFGNSNGAYFFDGNDHMISPHQPWLNVGTGSRTFSGWFRQTEVVDFAHLMTKGQFPGGHNIYLRVYSEGFEFSENSQADSFTANNVSCAEDLNSSWNHLIGVKNSADGTMNIFLDGILICSDAIDSPQYSPDNEAPLAIGVESADIALPSGPQYFVGDLDDLGIWNRALTSEEIQALFLGEPLTYGCTNPGACNFQEEANADNGSCVSCEVLASACGEGTVWDSTMQQCVSIAPPCAPSCGEGTVWDPVNEECIIAIPADLNYDGCVSVNDLLVLLAVHGTCPPYPEWPDEPTDTTWTCGDPLTYWDCDYATVLIGDQCWFAENLRNEKYANGDFILTALNDSEWSSTNEGASTVYGEGISNCLSYSPNIDDCDELASLSTYGRLYNWFAVDDTRGLCPAEWHVPSADEWNNLAAYISNQGFTGIEGAALKATSGWNNNGNGFNEFGFSGLPGGFRHREDGQFVEGGNTGYYFTSTLNTYALYRRLYSGSSAIISSSAWPRAGLSVRCIKD